MKFLGLISSVLLLFVIHLTANQPIPYSGKISIRGVNYDGDAQFTFSLQTKDGKNRWRNGNKKDDSIKVRVRNGFYNVLLGGQGMNTLPPQLFLDYDELYLKVRFDNGDGKGLRHLEPDQRITATPRALVAEVAKKVVNGAITREMLSSEVIAKLDENASVANGSITASKIANNTITKAQLNDQILKYLKPEITIQPQAQNVYADSNVSYSVTVEGKYLTYQWKKDGVDLTGETNATLNITDANATLHDGNYSVVVSNDFGSLESAEILLDVNTTWSTDGLVGWWKFDEGSGTVAYDSSGNGHDGNLTNGPTWATGKIGGALSFDGVDDYIDIENYYGISANDPRTTSAWLRNNFQYSATHHRPIISWGSQSTGEEWKFFILEGKMKHYNWGGSVTGSTILDSNQWIHVVSVLPKGATSTSSIIFYHNGYLENLQFTNSTIDTGSDVTVKIGADLGSSRYKGLIDDVRIYDRALSSAEVQALYNLGQ